MNQKFRELPSIDHWSASIPLGATSPEDFGLKLREVVEKTRQNFMGFITAHDNAYTRTRYPRPKYGVPSIDVCRASMAVMAQKLNAEMTERVGIKEARFRIVLGLLEGYDKGNNLHSIKEVEQVLGHEFTIHEGEVYSAGFLFGAEYAVYREPAAVIEGNPSNIERVYALADHFKQERFTVDDFQAMKSYTVEIRSSTL